jgi:hypothetical protein
VEHALGFYRDVFDLEIEERDRSEWDGVNRRFDPSAL